MIAARFIEAGNEMGAAWTGRTATYREPSGELGLARSGKRGAFFVANADPLDVAAANRVGERIKRVADQSENVLDSDLLERADQNIRHCLRHRRPLLP